MGDAGRVGVARRPWGDDSLLELVEVGDFSPIGPGKGHQGARARGRLFSASAEFMQAIFDDLPGYNTASIFENVLMNSADAKTVTEKLGCQPVFACAGDFGWVTRPRLWWLSVKWGDLTSDPSAPPWLGQKRMASTAYSSIRPGRRSPTSTWAATAFMLMWPRGANTCRAPLHQRPLKKGDRHRSPAEAEQRLGLRRPGGRRRMV